MNLTSNSIALVGATLIDGTGQAPINDSAILIEGDRIIAAGARATVVIPPDAQVVDLRGKYVMPGMMDANVHLYFAFGYFTAGLLRYEGRYEELILEGAQIALKSGLTTVFDTWGPRKALTHVRDRINQGEEVGSRIFLAGNIIGMGGPTSVDSFPESRTVLSKREADKIDARWEQGVGQELLWMTPEEVRARIRAYIESGTQDFLKYLGSGHKEEYHIAFSQPAQNIIVEEGHKAGITVQAHTTHPESLRMEIEAGADLLQHGSSTGIVPMPEETLATIVARKIPIAAMFHTRKFLESQDTRPGVASRKYRIQDENDRRLIAAGATILLTTDAGPVPDFSGDDAEPPLLKLVTTIDSPLTLGEGHFLWLEAAAELGMKPMDALLAATKNPAEAYGVGADLGTLQPGKRADLLVLSADPLADPKNYRRIEKVMKDGTFVEREQLPQIRVLTNRG